MLRSKQSWTAIDRSLRPPRPRRQYSARHARVSPVPHNATAPYLAPSFAASPGATEPCAPFLFQGSHSRLQADRQSADLQLGRPCPGIFLTNHTQDTRLGGFALSAWGGSQCVEDVAADARPCIQISFSLFCCDNPHTSTPIHLYGPQALAHSFLIPVSPDLVYLRGRSRVSEAGTCRPGQ